MLALVPLLALAAAPHVATVPGAVHDAFADGADPATVWVSTTDDGGRKLWRLPASGRAAPGPHVPDGAVFATACPGVGGAKGLVFVDADGAVDGSGARRVKVRTLFVAPDPDRLLVGRFCARPGGVTELRLPTPRGLHVSRGTDTRTLAWPAAVRGYAGGVRRGLKARRPYDVALSVYAPALFDADTNGDGRDDLVVVHEGRLAVFLRSAAGPLERTPAHVRDLGRELSGADVRVHIGRVDGDRYADALVHAAWGAVPRKSELWVIAGSPAHPALDDAPTRWLQTEGFASPLAIVDGAGVVAAFIDTSAVALADSLLTGEADVEVARLARAGARAPLLSLRAEVDLRGGGAGTLPAAFDAIAGGGLDVVALDPRGRLVIHRAARGGTLVEAARYRVPAFVHHKVLDDALVLFGAPRAGKSKVTVLRPEAARRDRVR